MMMMQHEAKARAPKVDMQDRDAAVRLAYVLGVPDVTGPRNQEIIAEAFARHREAALSQPLGREEISVLREALQYARQTTGPCPVIDNALSTTRVVTTTVQPHDNTEKEHLRLIHRAARELVESYDDPDGPAFVKLNALRAALLAQPAQDDAPTWKARAEAAEAALRRLNACNLPLNARKIIDAALSRTTPEGDG